MFSADTNRTFGVGFFVPLLELRPTEKARELRALLIWQKRKVFLVRRCACSCIPRKRGLGGGESSDRQAVGTTRNIIETGAVAECNRSRIPTVLAADPHLELRLGGSSPLDSDLDKRAHSGDVETRERIARKNALVDVVE